MNILEHLKDRIQGKAPKGAKRSSKWRKVRKEHIKKHPRCALCNSNKKIEVHHKIPFHIAPDLELEPENLMTLCESGEKGVICHRFFGHLSNYRKWNLAIEQDVMVWRMKLGLK